MMLNTFHFHVSPVRASFSRHCEERSDEAIQSVSSGGYLDCFAEPVIGPRFARTRWLAMTTESASIRDTPTW